jgi:protein SYS1
LKERKRMFYSNVFDPQLIVAQIILLQGLSYLTIILFLFLFHEMLGTRSDTLTLHHVLSRSALDETGAFLYAFVNILNGFFIGVYLSFIVERAKKCLDFASTLYFFHFMITWWYDGFPWGWQWWVLNIVALVCAAVSGEWLCMRRELREIKTSDFLSVRALETEQKRNEVLSSGSGDGNSVSISNNNIITTSSSIVGMNSSSNSSGSSANVLRKEKSGGMGTSSSGNVNTTGRDIAQRASRSDLV